MGYKVTFGSGHSVVFDNEPTQADIEEAEASLGLTQKKPEATWGEALTGGLTDLGKTLALGGLSVLGAFEDVDEYLRQNSPNPKRRQMEPKTSTGELMAGARQFYNEADPTKDKQLSGLQRGARAGVQLGGALAGGSLGIGAMLAGETTDQAMQMLDEGMPLDKAQAFMRADAALNTASMALGGVGKSALTQGVTTGLGNMAGDEASHLLANAFRESEGLRQNERDNVDRAISFGFGFGPGYIAKRIENATQVDQGKNVEADAKAKIEEFLATKEAQDPLNKPSLLELLPKESYPEPLGNRSIDPDTKTVTTGMAEDVPTIDFPLRLEAMERDRKFQRLLRDLIIERQILDDYIERGLGAEDIKQQEAAVEQARQSFAKYLDEGYGIKETSDIYGRSIYESNRPLSLAIQHGFDPKEMFDRSTSADGGLSLVPKEGETRTNSDRIVKTTRPYLGKPEAIPVREVPTFEKSKEISLKEITKNWNTEKKELGLVDYYKGNSNEFVGRIKELIDAGDYNGALDYIA